MVEHPEITAASAIAANVLFNVQSPYCQKLLMYFYYCLTHIECALAYVSHLVQSCSHDPINNHPDIGACKNVAQKVIFRHDECNAESEPHNSVI